MNDTISVLKNRRSIKSFKDKKVPQDVLEQILEAGTYAPNGMGLQSPKIVVIQDPDTIEKMSRWNKSFYPDDIKKDLPEDFDPFYGAKTLLIVLADENVPTHVQDACLVMGNLLNAACSLGVDSCWIHRAKEEFDTQQGKELLKVWNITSNYVGIAHCILGYRNDDYEVKLEERKSDYIIYGDLE